MEPSLDNDHASLNELFNDAMEKRIKFQYKDAQNDCDKIISAFNQRDLANMSSAEKKILALSHTLKADMLCIGSVEEQNLAIDHIDTALTIDPHLEEAKLMKDILFIENNFPFKLS
jgi:hypothetical protein